VITKRIDSRKDGKSSAHTALRYGEGLKIDRETGEYLDKSHRTRFGNFGLVDDGVYEGRGTDVMSELIELAAIEMQDVLDLNTRVGADKKLAHFVVSFNQEKPSEAVLRDTEDSMLAALQLNNNHFATFLHNDNGHWHLHIFSSRIEKEPPHRGNALWRDQILRDRVCREIEIRHNLIRDEGAHRVNEVGAIIEIPLVERRALRKMKKEQKGDSVVVSDKAKSAEIHSGEKSFQTWVNEFRLGDRLKHAKSWQDLHTAAAAYGCEVKPKGAGFVICPLNENGGIQLSKIGFKNLPAKFGAFQAPKFPQSLHVAETAYVPFPTNEKAIDYYDSWRSARDAYRPLKTNQINVQREAHKQIRKDLRAQQKLELAQIRSETKGAERLAAASIAKMQHAVALTELTDTFSRERLELRKQLAEHGPGNTFRDFLVKVAEKGDDKALQLARKYGVDESTVVSRQREVHQLRIVATVTGHSYQYAQRLSFSHRIERSGTVVFNLGHGRTITDSAISKQVQLNAIAANDPEAIAIALRFATTKFGNNLTLTGSDEFQRLAVETSVRKGLNVDFKDPALQTYKQEFAALIHQDKIHVTRSQPYQTRQIPPAHRRNRLHQLSELTLVSKSKAPEVLLPKDVSRRMADRSEFERDGAGLRRIDDGGRAAAALMLSRPNNITQVPHAAVAAAEKHLTVQQEPNSINHIQAIASQISAEQWAQEFAESSGKRLVEPSSYGGGLHPILFIASDRVVLDQGRSIAVYPKPKDLELQVGNRVVVGEDMALKVHQENQRDLTR
jgi:hypothetical protein